MPKLSILNDMFKFFTLAAKKRVTDIPKVTPTFNLVSHFKTKQKFDFYFSRHHTLCFSEISKFDDRRTFSTFKNQIHKYTVYEGEIPTGDKIFDMSDDYGTLPVLDMFLNGFEHDGIRISDEESPRFVGKSVELGISRARELVQEQHRLQIEALQHLRDYPIQAIDNVIGYLGALRNTRSHIINAFENVVNKANTENTAASLGQEFIDYCSQDVNIRKMSNLREDKDRYHDEHQILNVLKHQGLLEVPLLAPKDLRLDISKIFKQ